MYENQIAPLRSLLLLNVSENSRLTEGVFQKVDSKTFPICMKEVFLTDEHIECQKPSQYANVL